MVRIKERYLLVNILYPPSASEPDAPASGGLDLVSLHQSTTDALTSQALIRGIRAQATELFGDYGAGVISVQVKYLSHATSTLILRIHRAHFRLLWATLTLMNRVPVKNGLSCVFRVARVSGTIRRVQEEAVRRAKRLILAAKDEAANRGSAVLTANILLLRPDEPTNDKDDMLMQDAMDPNSDLDDGD